METDTEEYMDIERRQLVAAKAQRFRKKFLRFKDAEIVYSIQHKKLVELADDAGALYRIDGYVLIDRDIFDSYLERFSHKPHTKGEASHPKNRYMK